MHWRTECPLPRGLRPSREVREIHTERRIWRDGLDVLDLEAQATSASDQEWLRIISSPVVSSVPNSQTWLGLLAAEPIETELSAGIGLGEVVHDEPFQLASSTAWVSGLCTLKIQTSESDLAAIANTPAPAKLDGDLITFHDVPLKCSRRGPVPLDPPTHTSVGESASTDSKSVPLGPDSVETLQEVPL